MQVNVEYGNETSAQPSSWAWDSEQLHLLFSSAKNSIEKHLENRLNKLDLQHSSHVCAELHQDIPQSESRNIMAGASSGRNNLRISSPALSAAVLAYPVGTSAIQNPALFDSISAFSTK